MNFYDDCEAIDLVFKEGGSVSHGEIIIPSSLKVSEELNEAIDYLCNEWDYCCSIKEK